MNSEPHSVRKNIWINIIFFAVTTLGGVLGVPIYYHYYGVTAGEIALALFFASATGLSITVGYHRLFSHATFKANPVVRFLLLFFGAAAFEQPALMWASQHRDHHRYVDTDLDPYSIKKGFFYAHVGWLIFWEHKINYENAKDLQQDPVLMHQFNHYLLWCSFAGIIFPVLIGAMMGHALGAFLLSVCLRITFVYHSTFCINSVCHMFGKSTYDIEASAKDHWLVAIITGGEGYHNFHHRFPSDYRNGVRWYHFDPSKWLIALMERLHLAWDLKTVSMFRILGAQLAAENKRMRQGLEKTVLSTKLTQALESLKHHYQRLSENLTRWENVAQKEYRLVLSQPLKVHAAAMDKEARKQIEEARQKFKATYHRWAELMRQEPRHLAQVLLSSALI